MEGWEFIAVAAVILLLFGANRLPKIARQLGEAKTEMDRMRLDVMGEGPDADGADAALPPVVAVTDPADAADLGEPADAGVVALESATSVPAAPAAAPAAFAAPDLSRPVSEPARSRTLPPPLPPPG